MKFKSGVIAAALVLLASGTSWAQTRIVTGKVADSLTNEPITSGQVSVVGTAVGATIKDDGTFTMAVPTRDVVITVRSIGFKRRDVPVPANQNSVQVGLDRDFFQLEAIVVTGQATGIERRNLANAVSSVNADQMTKAPTGSVEEALQGKMAGAQILSNTGAPGGGSRMRLRGVTSILGLPTPLYVVDGVIISDVSLGQGTNVVSKASGGSTISSDTQDNVVNRVADLNPNEIENVEVLKGAAASAIYGSKASNGVIIITTKRGRVGTPQFSVTQRFGTSRLSSRIGSRYFGDITSAVKAWGTLAGDSVNNIPGVAGLGWTPGYTPLNFEDLLYNDKPLGYETSVSVNGGTDNTRYFASGLSRHEGGVVHNTYANKQSLRLNLDQNVGSRVQFQANTEIIRNNSDRGLTGNDNTGTSYGFVIFKSPNFFDMRAVCPDGSRQAFCDGGVYPSNPYSSSNALQTASLFKNTETVWRAMSSGSLRADLISSHSQTLRASVNGGVDIFTQKNVIISPPELQFEPVDGTSGTYALSYVQNQNMNVASNLVHTFKPGAGKFTATTSLGLQYETRDLQGTHTAAKNLLGGIMNLGAGTQLLADEVHTRAEDFGMFAQEEFLTFGDKALFTAAVRADQSSTNGDPNQLFYYPKGSVSYRFPNLAPGVDELKLRLAYGQSGNQPTTTAKFTNLSSVQIGSQGGFTTGTTAGNANIRPERQRELEGGFDATLIKSRANIEFTFFEKRITDLRLNHQLAPSTGYNTEVINGGVLRTQGIETSLNVVGVQSPKVQWSTRLNFARNRSIVVSLPVGVAPFQVSSLQTGAFKIAPGQSPTALWGNDTLPGSQNVCTAVTTGCASVGALWTGVGACGNCVQAVNGGRVIGELTPKFSLSMSNDLTYKAAKLYWLWDWQDGGMLAAGAWRHNEISADSPDYATLTAPTPGFPNGEQIGAQRVRWYTRVTRTYFQPAGYLKLREVQITVNVPQNMVRKVWSGARYVRLGISGRNLLQITPYRGGDPEAANFTFSDALPGARELMAYPMSRSFWASVDVGF